MKSKSSLDQLNPEIKSALIEKILIGQETFDDMKNWLDETQSEPYSRSAIHRFAQTIKSAYSGLVDLGMPPKVIADHTAQLEKLGIYLVQREVLNLRIDALQKSIFSDLGDINQA